MICNQCQKEIAENSNFCYLCGARQATAPPNRRTTDRKLRRSKSDVAIAGVCAGIAEFLEVDVSLVRVVAVILGVFPGMFIGGVVAYLLAWMVMPEATSEAPPAPLTGRPVLRRSTTDRKFGGVCGGFAESFGIDSTVIRLIWLLMIFLAGTGVLTYIICWIVIPLGSPAPALQAAPRAS
ncbi:MAG: PspC domain-containing protein [Acidobacteria bacterium]|nr:PspC domain-containing protein [Acidobacteriota bacterium]